MGRGTKKNRKKKKKRTEKNRRNSESSSSGVYTMMSAGGGGVSYGSPHGLSVKMCFAHERHVHSCKFSFFLGGLASYSGSDREVPKAAPTTFPFFIVSRIPQKIQNFPLFLKVAHAEEALRNPLFFVPFFVTQTPTTHNVPIFLCLSFQYYSVYNSCLFTSSVVGRRVLCDFIRMAGIVRGSVGGGPALITTVSLKAGTKKSREIAQLATQPRQLHCSNNLSKKKKNGSKLYHRRLLV